MSRPARVVAIGLGPFNLGLAALAAPQPDVEVTVLESRETFRWHEGMLLETATIQVPFIADLVTFADPTSEFSFLAYLKAVGRLYSFYIRESWYPFRREYDAYCRWVASRLDRVLYGHHVTAVEHVEHRDVGAPLLVTAQTPAGVVSFPCDHVVVGTGTTPTFPAALSIDDDRVTHSADYLTHREDLLLTEQVVVVGSGQSAAEVYLDLLRRGARHVLWVTRSRRFFPMEVTPLTLEMTSPEYRRHFLALDHERQRSGRQHQVSLYKGISEHTIKDIYDELTVRGLDAHLDGSAHGGLDGIGTELIANVCVSDARPTDDGIALTIEDNDTGITRTVTADRVVCGTGYTPREHPYLDTVQHLLQRNAVGDVTADAQHSIDSSGRRLFAQNTGEQLHPLTAADLGMGPMRNSEILATITGRDVYPVEKRIAFQTFGLAESDGGSR